MNIKNIIALILISFLTYTSCIAKRKNKFQFPKGERKEFIDNIIHKWARKHKFNITYITFNTSQRTVRRRTISTPKGNFNCMTHLANSYPTLKIPCTYCLVGETLIKGSDYKAHHRTYHNKNKGIRGNIASSVSPIARDRTPDSLSDLEMRSFTTLCQVATALLENKQLDD